jgi:hypothetical protein
MTPTRMPSYAKQPPYETGRPSSGLIRKALSHNHKIQKSNPSSVTALPTKGFDLARTDYARNTDDQLDINMIMAMTTGSRFSDNRATYRSLQALKRLRAI